MRRSSRATRDQLGAANVPDAHLPGAAPAGHDERVDELPADAPLVRSPAELMRWRGPQSVGAGPGPATDAGGEYGITPSAHSGGGRPDARRVWDAPYPPGYAGGPIRPDLVISPEHPANVRIPEPIGAQAPPLRHRGGPTGDDPHRPSALALAIFARPFDVWAAHNFGVLDRIEMDSPRASTPYAAPSDVPHREPSAGGGYASPGIGPTVGAMANTYRLMPRAWDELLINTGQTGAGLPGSADAGRRAGGWRSRG